MLSFSVVSYSEHSVDTKLLKGGNVDSFFEEIGKIFSNLHRILMVMPEGILIDTY